MNHPFATTLADEAAQPFRAAGHFAYHFARGKLGGDCIFRELLRRGVFPASGHFLDLGCGQAVFASWLLAARRRFERGNWPDNWPPPPHEHTAQGEGGPAAGRGVHHPGRRPGGRPALSRLQRHGQARLLRSRASVAPALLPLPAGVGRTCGPTGLPGGNHSHERRQTLCQYHAGGTSARGLRHRPEISRPRFPFC